MRKVRADCDPAVLLNNGFNCLNGTNLVCTHLLLYLNITIVNFSHQAISQLSLHSYIRFSRFTLMIEIDLFCSSL